MKKQIVVLAAGKGSRMQSNIPKVMHKICGKKMLDMVLSTAESVTKDIILVYSPEDSGYFKEYSTKCELVPQEVRLGTAHAVYSALGSIKKDAYTIVLYGDNPLISGDIIKSTLQSLIKETSSLITLAFLRDDPGAYGRIILEKDGSFSKIVEFKHASEEEQGIKLCNSGIMIFAPGILNQYIERCIEAPLSEEAYLTKIVEIAKNAGEKVSYFLSENPNLVIGVNTKEELKKAEEVLYKSKAISDVL